MTSRTQLAIDLTRLCRDTPTFSALAPAALTLIGDSLDTRFVHLGMVDPLSLQPTVIALSPALPRLPGPLQGLLAKLATRRDLDPDDPLSVAALMRRSPPVATHRGTDWTTVPGGKRGLGLLRRVAMADEVRLALTCRGDAWGVLGAMSTREPFSERQIKTLLEVAPILGNALRIAFLAGSRKSARAAPGLILLDEEGRVDYVGAEARRLLGPEDAERFHAWLGAMVESSGSQNAPATFMTDEGPVTAHMTDGRRAIILERTSALSLVGHLMLARGLSPREQQVAEAVCAGWDTRRIAFELDIADGTVKRHLSAVFDKFGVNGRQELLSSLVLGPAASGALSSPAT